jgi:hypothetical protein
LRRGLRIINIGESRDKKLFIIAVVDVSEEISRAMSWHYFAAIVCPLATPEQ